MGMSLGRNVTHDEFQCLSTRSIPVNRLSYRYVTETLAVQYTYHHHHNDSRYDDDQALEQPTRRMRGIRAYDRYGYRYIHV
jgi:hypothetical protein